MINKLYLEIKTKWNELRQKIDADTETLEFLVHLLDEIEAENSEDCEENGTMEFGVIDPQTGGYPDVEKIALTEEWAKHLIYCDIDSFAITEDGQLLLTDDCDNIAYCPAGRFKIVTKL